MACSRCGSISILYSCLQVLSEYLPMFPIREVTVMHSTLMFWTCAAEDRDCVSVTPRYLKLDMESIGDLVKLNCSASCLPAYLNNRIWSCSFWLLVVALHTRPEGALETGVADPASHKWYRDHLPYIKAVMLLLLSVYVYVVQIWNEDEQEEWFLMTSCLNCLVSRHPQFTRSGHGSFLSICKYSEWLFIFLGDFWGIGFMVPNLKLCESQEMSHVSVRQWTSTSLLIFLIVRSYKWPSSGKDFCRLAWLRGTFRCLFVLQVKLPSFGDILYQTKVCADVVPVTKLARIMITMLIWIRYYLRDRIRGCSAGCSLFVSLLKISHGLRDHRSARSKRQFPKCLIDEKLYRQADFDLTAQISKLWESLLCLRTSSTIHYDTAAMHNSTQALEL